MMRRSSSVESPASQGLHPTLQALLKGLDIELEAELAHYRRQRDRRPGKIERAFAPLTGRKPTQTAAIGAAGVTLPLTSSSAPVAPDSTPALGSSSPTPITPDPWAALALAESVEQEQSPEVGGSLATIEPDLRAGDDLAEPEIEHPDDYLESSEELLKSLAEEEADLRAKQEPGMLETLLTPLGIGSILLLLLSSLTFGYLIMNPSSLRVLGLDRLINGSHSPEAPQPSPEASSNQSDAIPTSPNLASQEFVDLNLNTLSTLPVRPTTIAPASNPSPSASPSPASVSAQPLAVRSAPAPSSASSTLPSVPVPRQSYRSAPAPAPTPVRPRTEAAPGSRSETAPVVRSAPPPTRVEPQQAPSVAAAPSSSTSNQPRYRVVINYSGDASLNQVRQVVPDAYVRNSQEGAQVQAGNFSDEENAQQLIQQLEQQGISAEISRP